MDEEAPGVAWQAISVVIIISLFHKIRLYFYIVCHSIYAYYSLIHIPLVIPSSLKRVPLTGREVGRGSTGVGE